MQNTKEIFKRWEQLNLLEGLKGELKEEIQELFKSKTKEV